MNTTKTNIKSNSFSKMMITRKSISKIVMLSLPLLFLGFSSFAKSSKTETKGKENETSEIRKQLFNQIQFPDFMKDNNSVEESVNVFFQVEKNGNIKVLKTDYKNDTLNKFIIDELKKAKLESLEVNEENVYKINIRFKLL